jgi:hypothetical protein
MPPPTGFEYVIRGGDDVLITNQHVMARVTGNYKRGDERR